MARLWYDGWLDTRQTAELTGLSVDTLKSARTGRRSTPTPSWEKDEDNLRVWYALEDVLEFCETRDGRRRKT
ncbi:MAG: hypothetical protein U9Q81_00620 [Pseudomonadota bacterium]|nr:hypothetical protein [Pseudomonadota bacterium]